MHIKKLISGLLISTTLVMASAIAKPIPAEALAKLSAISSVSMSADGKQLVALVAAPGSDNKDTALATWDLTDLDKPPVITPSGKKMKFIAASALKAGKILVIARQEWTGPLAGCGEGKALGSTATFVFKTYLTDAKHSKFKEAFVDGIHKLGVSKRVKKCLELTGSASLVNTLPLDPTKVIIQRVNGLTLQSNYFLYDLKTEESELLIRAGRRATPGLFNPRNGQLLTRNLVEPVGPQEYEARILIRNAKTGEFELHPKLTTKLSERYTVQIAGIDDATGQYYILTDLFSEQVEAWMYDPIARSFSKEALVGNPKYPITGLIFGDKPSNFNKLLGFTVTGGDTKFIFVDEQMRSISDGLKSAFPGQAVRLISYTDDLSRILFVTQSAQKSPTYRLLLDKTKVKILGGEKPWINSTDIGEQRWVKYTARDGLPIYAILDLPAGWKKSDGPLPTVIHPHGGPWARDTMGWDRSGFVQFLSSRGYAVLRPQYRGSTGLGRKLWIAGDAQWGKSMQDDLDDAAKWLEGQGISDPDRLAIFGYSYGGFASVAASVRPNSPFQCAIAGAPVADLTKLGNNWSTNRLQRILQGHTVDGMDPMKNTDKANIPILLFVGDRDVRTPSWHAKNFYNAVKGKVPAKFELIDDMPHQMPWYYSQHIKILNLLGDFLKTDCGPGGL